MALDSPWARPRRSAASDGIHARNPEPIPDVVVTQTVYSGATQTAQPNPTPGTKFPLGSVIGGVLGGIFIVVVIVILWKWWGRSLKRKEHLRFAQASVKSSLKTSVTNARAPRTGPARGHNLPPVSRTNVRPSNKGPSKSVGFAGLPDENDGDDSLDEKHTHIPSSQTTPSQSSSDSGIGEDVKNPVRSPFANPVRSYAPARPSPLSRPVVASVIDRNSAATQGGAEENLPPTVGYAV